jgi:hypothetical protein
MGLEPAQPDVRTANDGPVSSSRWAGLVLVVSLAAPLLLLAKAPSTQDQEGPAAPPLFQGWGKPDLAIVVSGQTHGYLQPCGCSRPQFGGLARRYNFIKSLKDKGWQVVAVDLGDILQTHGPLTRLKYATSMKALQLMGYSAVGIGQRELLMPLHDALAEFSVDHEKPRPVALNLANIEKKEQVFFDLNARQYEIVNTKPSVGVIGLVGNHVAERVVKKLPSNEKEIRFTDNGKLLGPALQVLAQQKVDFAIVLYQGKEKEEKKDEATGKDEIEEPALACAEYCHQLHAKDRSLTPVRLIVCLSDDDEPPSAPTFNPRAPSIPIVTLGHKGRYVGVIGFFKKGAALYSKYQLVSIGPDFETKSGLEKANPVNVLMEDYAKAVQKGGFLGKWPRGKHAIQVKHANARYVGSDRCADCHEHAYAVWEKSGHAHAYDTLVNATNPSLRQHDPECIMCHTVGFQHPTGYFDPPQGSTPKQVDKHNVKLRHVGCENCHGPCSDHVNNPQDKALYPVINPFRAPANENEQQKKNRMLRLDFFCQKCHDIENDVHWNKVDFIQGKWMKIEHATPKGGKGKKAAP